MGGWTDGKRGSQYLLNLADRTENHTRRMWQCSSSHFSGQLRRPGQACAGAELSGLLVATPPEKMRRRPVGPQTRLGRAAPGILGISTAREIASPAIVRSSRPAGARPPREPCAPARWSQRSFLCASRRPGIRFVQVHPTSSKPQCVPSIRGTDQTGRRIAPPQRPLQGQTAAIRALAPAHADRSVRALR